MSLFEIREYKFSSTVNGKINKKKLNFVSFFGRRARTGFRRVKKPENQGQARKIMDEDDCRINKTCFWQFIFELQFWMTFFISNFLNYKTF